MRGISDKREFYVVYADRGSAGSRLYLMPDGGYGSERHDVVGGCVRVGRDDRMEMICGCRHFDAAERHDAEMAAERSSRAYASFGYSFKVMLIVPRSAWAKIGRDFKGKWSREDAEFRGDLPPSHIGRRTMMVGCSHGYTGCVLLTEGLHFEIV